MFLTDVMLYLMKGTLTNISGVLKGNGKTLDSMGVDATPTASSKNLIESGGVKAAITSSENSIIKKDKAASWSAISFLSDEEKTALSQIETMVAGMSNNSTSYYIGPTQSAQTSKFAIVSKFAGNYWCGLMYGYSNSTDTVRFTKYGSGVTSCQIVKYFGNS
mgnify:CR=1 FL=1